MGMSQEQRKSKDQNQNRFHGLPVVLAVGGLWLFLALFCWLKPSAEQSFTERRLLSQFPKLTWSGIRTGFFMDQYEEAATDQFPLRESFRSLRAISDIYGLQKKDVHGIYEAQGYLVNISYPLNETSVQNAGEKSQRLYDTYMQDTQVQVYMAVIPDKHYYLGEDNGYPTMDYTRLIDIMTESFPEAEQIPLEDTLSISSYYQTDSHWRQEQLMEPVARILEYMEAEPFEDLQEQKAMDSFRGVYAGQMALPVEGESMYYLTNEVLEQCQVYNVERNETIGIYREEALSSRDPYEFFLSGSAAILIIENPSGNPDRELVVFRDSFGSSMVPLLLRSYRKVTVIDTRYVNPELIGDYVEFQDQDVLFLYNSLFLNQSETMR